MQNSSERDSKKITNGSPAIHFLEPN